MLKYANFEIMEAKVARRGNGLMKGAHRAVFDYTPQEGFLYVRSRAISSRCNDNYDEFPAEEIRKSWRSFVGKPVFVNHHNSDTSRARGVIIDAALHEDRNPDGSPDTWVEVLMEVDAIKFPKLADGILAGDIERTSMGCDVAFSVCSACGNRAYTPLDYCFPPGAPVWMADGTIRAIEDVVEGDRVLTHDGVGVVTATMRREYEGHLATISRQGATEPIRVTWGHEVMVNQVGGRNPNSPDRYASVHASENWGWVRSEDIRDGHWTQMAWPTQERGFVISPESLDERFAIKAGLVRYGAVYESGSRRGHIQWGKHGIEPIVGSRDLALATIIGLYLAEGSLSGSLGDGVYKEIQWAFHEDELGLVDDLQTALDKLGAGSLRHYARGSTKGVSVRLSNAPLATLLALLCGQGSSTKQLDGRLMVAPLEFQARMLGAYLDGDGYKDPRGHFEARTASPVLARQLVILGARLYDSIPTIWRNDNQPGGPGDRSKSCTIYHVSIGRHGSMKGRRHLDAEGYAAVRVENVGCEEYVGPVYNIEVDGQHSYVVDGMVVHNCQHIPKQKGLKLHRKNSSTGESESVLIREICYGLGFFENSLLVEDPADPTAYFLGVDDRGLGGGYTGSLPKEESGNISTASRNISGGTMTKAASKRAINEVKAPSEIDTLRDESCPICGDSDSFDGERCLVCNYVKPPDPFMDPNLELAQQVDLRQDEFGEDGDDVTVEDQPDDGFTLDPDPDSNGAVDLAPEDELALDSVTPNPSADVPGNPLPGATQQGRSEPGDEFTLPEGGSVDPLGNQDPARVEVEVDEGAGLGQQPQPNQQMSPVVGPDLEKPQDAGDQSQIGPTTEQQPSAEVAPTDDNLDPFSPFTDPAPVQQDVVPAAPAQQDLAPDPDLPVAEDGEDGEDQGFSLIEEDPEGESEVPDSPVEAPEDLDPDSPSDDESDDDDSDSDPVQDEETPPKGQTDKHKRSHLMRPALRAIAEQQVRLQATEEKVALIANLAGVTPQMRAIDKKASYRIAALRRRADADNPAQPVKQPSTEAPTDSTQEALGDVKRDQPEGGSQPSANDITNPGSTDTTDVSPDATTTVTDPVVAARKQGEAILDEPLNLNKEDVTQPVDGTTDKRPLNEVRIETDIETSPSAESETQDINDAQGIDGANATPAEKVSAQQRTFSSIRLARLRIQAGIVPSQDDLLLGDQIARSAMSDHDIRTEINTLEAVAKVRPNKVIEAAGATMRTAAQRPTRSVPSFAPTAGFQPPQPSLVAGTPSSDEFLFD